MKNVTVDIDDATVEPRLFSNEINKSARLTNDLTQISSAFNGKSFANDGSSLETKWHQHHENMMHSHPAKFSLDYIYQLLQMDLKLFAHHFSHPNDRNSAELRTRRKLIIQYYADRNAEGVNNFLNE